MKKILKLKNVVLMVICISLISIALTGCTNTSKKDENTNSFNETSGDENRDNDSSDNSNLSSDELPIATIIVKDYGTIKAELYPNIAENTVKNFIALANSEFYNNLIFHRVIENFMIQGGDPTGTGAGGPGYSIQGEFSANGIKNSLKHEDGVLSMARSSSYNSAGSQFFIMTSKSSHLDGDYAAFGKVIEGLDIVYSIASAKVNSNDKPLEDIVIESITVDTKGIEYGEPNKIN